MSEIDIISQKSAIYSGVFPAFSPLRRPFHVKKDENSRFPAAPGKRHGFFLADRLRIWYTES